MPEWLRIVIEALLGGGLLVTLLTLRATRRKAMAEAAGVERDNQSKDMNLGKQYVDAFTKNIVEPLKEELATLKQEVSNLKEEVKELKDAVQKANTCPHADECPVLHRLQKHQGNNARAVRDNGGSRIRGDPNGGERRNRRGDGMERHDADGEPDGGHDHDHKEWAEGNPAEGESERQ